MTKLLSNKLRLNAQIHSNARAIKRDLGLKPRLSSFGFLTPTPKPDVEGKASSAGITDIYQAQRQLISELLEYAPLGAIAVPQDNQALIVYSDALANSKALQEAVVNINKAGQGTRKIYLVNKQGLNKTSAEFRQFLGDLETKGITAKSFDFIFDNQNPGQAVNLLTPVLQRNNISQVRVFALTQEDMQAWSRQKLVDALILLLDSRQFVIFTPDDLRRELYEKSLQHTQSLQAA